MYNMYKEEPRFSGSTRPAWSPASPASGIAPQWPGSLPTSAKNPAPKVCWPPNVRVLPPLCRGRTKSTSQ